MGGGWGVLGVLDEASGCSVGGGAGEGGGGEHQGLNCSGGDGFQFPVVTIEL